ncbi:MAG: DUF4330 domain-containing protein [Ruminiclostridium sp.]|nr:DUF4330 domain-containing protein [Ruminiclostridium sp.]
MSIIDSKGKLFGKVNIIDLLVIIMIVAVVALLGTKLLNTSGDGLGGTGQKVVYTVKVDSVEEEVVQFIQKELEKGPCQLVASGELQNGYVTKMDAVAAEKTYLTVREIPTADLTALDGAIAGKYDVVFTIEATIQDSPGNKLGSQEIRAGMTHVVKTVTFGLENGIILTVDPANAAE